MLRFNLRREVAARRAYLNSSGKRTLELVEQTYWSMAYGKDVEFLLPLEYFDEYDSIFIRYQSTGVNTDGSRSNGADSSEYFRLDLHEQVYITEAKRLLSTFDGYSDPIGDPEGSSCIYDIEVVKIFTVQDKICIYAEFAGDISTNELRIHSIDIRNANDKSDKWFLQTWRVNMLNLWRNDKKIALKDFDIIRLKNGIFFILPRKLFTAEQLQIRYRAGAYDENGKGMINSDLAGYFLLKE